MIADTTDRLKDFSRKFPYYQEELVEIWRYNVATTESTVLEADERLPLDYQDLQ